MKELVEISAYIMNNVHYFQKFHLSCDLLHPLDLIYAVEKLLKTATVTSSSNIGTGMNNTHNSYRK